jgi:hypothetical protein
VGVRWLKSGVRLDALAMPETVIMERTAVKVIPRAPEITFAILAIGAGCADSGQPPPPRMSLLQGEYQLCHKA